MTLINKIKADIARPFLEEQSKKFELQISEYDLLPIDYTEPQDIFICGYPKSGNTWMQNLIAGIVFGISTEFLPDRLTQELVPDVHLKKHYIRFLHFSIFKSHHLPKPEYKKVIHLVRDGRDAMASYFAMNKAIGKPYTLEEMIIDGKGISSRWEDHTQAWIENPYNAQILVVKYEDLHIAPLKTMIKICHFLNIEREESLILRSINGNSFDKMREREKLYRWYQSWKNNNNLIRKGKIGSYKEEVPDFLITYFEKKARNQLLAFGYDYPEK
jgi:hypothetical protein